MPPTATTLAARHAVGCGGVSRDAGSEAHAARVRRSAGGRARSRMPSAAARGDDDGNGNPEHDVPRNAAAAITAEKPRLERASADPDHRLQHDRDDGRLQSVEERRDERHAAPRRRTCTRAPSRMKTDGNTKQIAGDEAAPSAVQQPADVDRELLRLGPGQQHAVVERVQEALLRDPAPPLDELAMHHARSARSGRRS